MGRLRNRELLGFGSAVDDPALADDKTLVGLGVLLQFGVAIERTEPDTTNAITPDAGRCERSVRVRRPQYRAEVEPSIPARSFMLSRFVALVSGGPPQAPAKSNAASTAAERSNHIAGTLEASLGMRSLHGMTWRIAADECVPVRPDRGALSGRPAS